MDSLGDILYLLIMVGVVIFGVIKKSKTSGGGEIMPEDEVHDYPSEAFPPLSKWLEEQLQEQADGTWEKEAKRVNISDLMKEHGLFEE